ncbi:MAG TPA: AAA family ATPase, partial [Solirubrobacteraceae bacterium]|nr:AAA family ATPase [Solirubrobacteraceae bacterium]
MRLVGREAELETLGGVVTDVRAGASRVVVMLGEAGIGKTALLGEAIAVGNQGGCLVLAGRAAEHEREVPYGLIVDALDDHVASVGAARLRAAGPELAGVLPSARDPGSPAPRRPSQPVDRFAHHRAVRSLLELLARERPLLLCLDDLHWADEGSVELLLHVLRRPPNAPHALLLCCRPSETADRLLDAARQADGLLELTLTPLPDAAARQLLPPEVDQRTGDMLVSEARGNPLFLRELGRAAQSGRELTATLLGAVRREVAALPPATRSLLEGAAVAGDPFEADVAAAAADIAPADALNLLDRLHESDLVRPGVGPRQFTFRHPLVRRAIYESAPPGFRVAAHERVSVVLTAAGAAPAARAHHVERCARPGDEASIEVLLAAAEASRGTAPATSAHWYAAALRLLPYRDDGRRASLLASLALGLAAGGKTEEAHTAVLDALAVAPAKDAVLRAELVAICASLENLLGRHEDARGRVVDALRWVSDRDREGLEWTLANTLFQLGDVEAMSEVAENLLDGGRATHPVVRAGADAVLASARLLCGEPAGDALDRGLRLIEETSDSELAPRLGVVSAVTLTTRLAERLDPAADALQTRFLELARAAGLGQLTSIAGTALAWDRLERLELDAALEGLETAEEMGRLSGGNPLHATNLRLQAQARELAGDAAQARRVAAVLFELADPPHASALLHNSRLVALVVLHRADPERLLAAVTEVVGPQLDVREPSDATWLALELTRAAAQLGDADTAHRWADHADRRAAAAALPL